MESKKMNNRLLIVFILTYFPITAFAANPLNTVNEYLNEPESGSGRGAGAILAIVLLYFGIAFWLLVSINSPIQAWVEKNKGLAVFCFFAFGPIILSVLSSLFK